MCVCFLRGGKNFLKREKRTEEEEDQPRIAWEILTPIININKIIVHVKKLPLKKKKKYIQYQTHNYIFSHFKICYLKYGTKHIFCIMNTLNTYFHNTF